MTAKSPQGALDIEDGLVSGRLWDEYCDAIKRVGRHLLRPEAPRDAFNQAEGVRYLTRMVRAGLELMVEAGTPEFPRFSDPAGGFIKIGGDNPDNLYLSTPISGELEYRIHGQRGDAPTINFATKNGGYQKPGAKMLGTGFLDGRELEVDEGGNFEILVSARRPPSGNWLPMEPDSNLLLIRQTFHDRRSEHAAQLHIERLGSTDAPPALDPQAFVGQLMAAARYTENTVKLFTDWAAHFKREHHNTLPLGEQSMFQAAGGDPNITYYHGYWELADDEAMVIEASLPPCEFWNFQVDNFWMESLDYHCQRIHLNCHGARLNPDGSVTIVVAHRDPGHPNWLTTAGHALGTSLFRLIGAQDRPAQIKVRIVNFDTLTGGREHGSQA
ncbi:DUF1214 domain-containing protein [Thauera terpenica]|nr:DUF1214 domain-containing protein [Thauera terpenica]